MEKGYRINITPFLAFAVAIGGDRVRKAIDKIYKSNRYEFYKYAKESAFYNNTVITGGDIITEEYARKALGIFLYVFDKQDEKVLKQIINAIKKNKYYKIADNYAVNCDTWEFESFAEFMNEKTNGEFIDKIDTDLFNSISLIGLFLARTYGKEIKENEGFRRFMGMLHDLETVYTKPNPVLKKDVLAKALMHKLFGTSKEERGYHVWRIWNVKHKPEELPGVSSVGVLFNLQHLETSCLERDVKVTDKDVEAIFKAFEFFKRGPASAKDTDVLLILYYFTVLLKAYNQVKEEFFKNNKETMFAEIEAVEKEKEALRIEKNRLEEENKRLRSELKSIQNQTHTIQKLEQDIEKMKEQLKAEQAKNAELNALREFIFSLKGEKEEAKEEEVKPVEIKGVFVGGYDSLLSKLKPYLPNFAFVPGDLKRFDESILDNAEVLVLHPEYLSHALYYFAVDEAKKRNIPILFVNGTNINKIVKKVEK